MVSPTSTKWPETPSKTSSVRSCASTPLEAISEHEPTSTFSALPAPALAFAPASSKMHSSSYARQVAASKRSPSSSPSGPAAKKKPGEKKQTMTEEERMAALMEFRAAMADDDFEAPVRTKGNGSKGGAEAGSAEPRRSVFGRMSEKLGRSRADS